MTNDRFKITAQSKFSMHSKKVTTNVTQFIQLWSNYNNFPTESCNNTNLRVCPATYHRLHSEWSQCWSFTPAFDLKKIPSRRAHCSTKGRASLVIFFNRETETVGEAGDKAAEAEMAGADVAG